MNIKPTNTPSPKYPVLAAVAVAATLATSSCQQQQQQGGAPPEPPIPLGGVIPAK